MSEAVDPALVAIRFLAYGLAMLAFGRASLALYASAAQPSRLTSMAVGAALAVAAIAYAVLLARAATGAAGWPQAAAIAMIWRDTGFGRALAVSAAAALALAGLGLSARPLRWPRLALAAVALGALAFVGHASDDTGLRAGVRLATLAVHLLAVAAWLGALPGLMQAISREQRPLALLARFGWVGGVSLGLVLVTGVATLIFVALDAHSGLGPGYLRTLAIKLGFVAGLVALAAINRFRLTPMMARAPDRTRGWLRATIAAEQALGLGALASVAVLGQLDPTM